MAQQSPRPDDAATAQLERIRSGEQRGYAADEFGIFAIVCEGCDGNGIDAAFATANNRIIDCPTCWHPATLAAQ